MECYEQRIRDTEEQPSGSHALPIDLGSLVVWLIVASELLRRDLTERSKPRC